MSATTTQQDQNLRAVPDILGEMAAASITVSYQPVLTTLLPWRVAFIKNNTNGILYVNWDVSGTNNNHKLAALQAQAIDCRSNGDFIPVGTIFRVKYTGAAPTTGDFVVEGISAQ